MSLYDILLSSIVLHINIFYDMDNIKIRIDKFCSITFVYTKISTSVMISEVDTLIFKLTIKSFVYCWHPEVFISHIFTKYKPKLSQNNYYYSGNYSLY